MLMKVCKECKLEKSLDEFYNRKIVKSGKYAKCKVCMSKSSKEWRLENIDQVKKQNKKYREENGNRIKKYYIEHSCKEQRKKYRIKNYEKARKYKRNIAKYNTYAMQISYAEEVRDSNDLLEVRCTYCGKFFQPSNLQVKHRIGGLKGSSSGENRFYCSTDCKTACPIYRQKIYEKGTKLTTSREVPAEFRKIALEDRNYTCEKCNSIEDGLHVHHIEGYTEQPMFMADLSNVIVVCKKCHKEIHKQKGCNYQDYQCANKKEEST